MIPTTGIPDRSRRLRAGMAVALTIALLPVGCGGGHTPPPPSDPDRAREALRTVLEAWKDGQGHDDLRQGSPPIHVADEDWRNGFELTGFEVSGDGRMVGNSLRCPVRLRLEAPGGSTVTKDVVYTIATEPRASVVRQDDT